MLHRDAFVSSQLSVYLCGSCFVLLCKIPVSVECLTQQQLYKLLWGNCFLFMWCLPEFPNCVCVCVCVKYMNFPPCTYTVIVRECNYSTSCVRTHVYIKYIFLACFKSNHAKVKLQILGRPI